MAGPLTLSAPPSSASGRWAAQSHSSHQREQDFGYSDKADGERDNGDGELLTDHGLSLEISGFCVLIYQRGRDVMRMLILIEPIF